MIALKVTTSSVEATRRTSRLLLGHRHHGPRNRIADAEQALVAGWRATRVDMRPTITANGAEHASISGEASRAGRSSHDLFGERLRRIPRRSGPAHKCTDPRRVLSRSTACCIPRCTCSSIPILTDVQDLIDLMNCRPSSARTTTSGPARVAPGNGLGRPFITRCKRSRRALHVPRWRAGRRPVPASVLLHNGWTGPREVLAPIDPRRCHRRIAGCGCSTGAHWMDARLCWSASFANRCAEAPGRKLSNLDELETTRVSGYTTLIARRRVLVRANISHCTGVVKHQAVTFWGSQLSDRCRCDAICDMSNQVHGNRESTWRNVASGGYTLPSLRHRLPDLTLSLPDLRYDDLHSDLVSAAALIARNPPIRAWLGGVTATARAPTASIRSTAVAVENRRFGRRKRTIEQRRRVRKKPAARCVHVMVARRLLLVYIKRCSCHQMLELLPGVIDIPAAAAPRRSPTVGGRHVRRMKAVDDVEDVVDLPLAPCECIIERTR